MTVGIAINVFQETPRQVSECFSRIASSFVRPTVKVFVTYPPRIEILRIAHSYEFAVEVGENLASNATWNLWWTRMLRFFQEQNVDICFKFDPDTMADAAPQHLPQDAYFGDLKVGCSGTLFVQGGVTGLSHLAVTSLLESGVLEAGSFAASADYAAASRCFMDDQMLADALHIVGIDPVQWRECRSEWRTPILNNPIRHALVHPRYYR